MGGQGSGGSRKNTGPKAVPYIVRQYRVPAAFGAECSAEIMKIIKKYRRKAVRLQNVEKLKSKKR